jgi:Zn-finger nucleic acid-binding protein
MGDEQEGKAIKIEAGCIVCPYCNGNLVIENGYKIGSFKIVCNGCTAVWVDEEDIE